METVTAKQAFIEMLRTIKRAQKMGVNKGMAEIELDHGSIFPIDRGNKTNEKLALIELTRMGLVIRRLEKRTIKVLQVAGKAKRYVEREITVAMFKLSESGVAYVESLRN